MFVFEHVTIALDVPGCTILAKNEYLIRHDKVCTYLHYARN